MQPHVFLPTVVSGLRAVDHRWLSQNIIQQKVGETLDPKVTLITRYTKFCGMVFLARFRVPNNLLLFKLI